MLTVDAATAEPLDAVWTRPRTPHDDGPVAVLIDSRTVSSGEGLARCVGGVAPAVRVPLDATTALAVGRGEDVALAAALEVIGRHRAG